MRKHIRGLEVYHFKDKETYEMYLLAIVYRADARGWERPKSYPLYGSRKRRWWQLNDAARKVWGAG